MQKQEQEGGIFANSFQTYFASLIALLAATLIAQVVFSKKQPNNNSNKTKATSRQFQQFQMLYLITYFFMVAADWLQGPYAYSICIFILLIFLTLHKINPMNTQLVTLVCCTLLDLEGTIIASFADTLGRKKTCLLYCFLYGAACLCIRFPQFWVLALGRVISGIAVSILFSSFESWMVKEHAIRKFHSDLLAETFYLQYLGNGFVAIACGLLADYVKDQYASMIAVYNTAIVFLFVGGMLVSFTWSENYGDDDTSSKKKQQGILHSFSDAFFAIFNDIRIFSVGLSQSLFDAALYTFVFMWTPLLDAANPTPTQELPHGIIFGCFMVAMMIGSCAFNMCTMSVFHMSADSFLLGVFVVSAASLLVPVLSANFWIVLIAMTVFEGCIGAFFPSIGTVRSKYIPDHVRSTVLNYFRVPSNFIVCILLQKIDAMSAQTVFLIATGFLLVCLCSHAMIMLFLKK